MLKVLPCLDSDGMAAARRRELDLSRDVAVELGRSAVEITGKGYYVCEGGRRVDVSRSVAAACAAKVSIPPEAALPAGDAPPFPETRVQVTNETTLGAARRLAAGGRKVVALNFANGTEPGGGFLRGATAQEEALCRSSALYATLVDDPMYRVHGRDAPFEASDWVIYSPDVPVFRVDDGTALGKPWLLSFITCAAPYEPEIGQPESGDLLQRRIGRVLAVARAYGHATLVLGAWGCGAFGNDPQRTARDFRTALETEFDGAFSDVVFAVADWSRVRRILGPFRDVFV
ncbi:MAG: TIGR02452 family protein [Acidobacteriota bacterium]|nr:TIGR02452 family protein [Acidobacteriota bacterium]